MLSIRNLLLAIAVVCVGAVLLPSAHAGPPAKVTICHIPPGNPANAHTITISEKALDAHLTNHGDYLGPCCTDDDSCSSGNLCEVFSCEFDGCVGAPVDCDDGNICTADSCESASGCSNNPTNVGLECAPNSVCDNAGACVEVPQCLDLGGECFANDECCDGLECCLLSTGCGEFPGNTCTPLPPVNECPCAADPVWNDALVVISLAADAECVFSTCSFSGGDCGSGSIDDEVTSASAKVNDVFIVLPDTTLVCTASIPGGSVFFQGLTVAEGDACTAEIAVACQ